MRCVRGVVVSGLVWAVAAVSARAETTRDWERMGAELPDARFVAVSVERAAPARVLAASRRALYDSSDSGRHWTERLRVPMDTAISDVALSPDEPKTILAATDHGLYGSFDGGDTWSHVFQVAESGANQCTAVRFHPSRADVAFVGTRGGLFATADRGHTWKTLELPATAHPVQQLAIDPQDPDRLCLITDHYLFTGNTATGHWEERLNVGRTEEETLVEEPDAAESTAIEPQGTPRRLNDVAIDPRQTSLFFLASTRGLEQSTDAGLSWQPLPQEGLASQIISRILLQHHSPLIIYAATSRGVARFDPARNQWMTLTRGLGNTRVNDLDGSPDQLWAATDDGLYRLEIPPDAFSHSEPPPARELLNNFVNEPPIASVQDAAIRYAQVHPGKIARWHREARLKALLPSVNVGLDRGRSRDIHVDEGTFPHFQLLPTENQDAGLKLSITWNLSSLIWDDDQTSIDVRSRLMVQLRDDILDEVTRAYFERRRLQLKLLTSPPEDQEGQLDAELRVQELTARINGLTGGYFSQYIKPDVN